MTDEAGAVRDAYEYSAFGELLSHTGSDPQPYAFTGEPLGPNSGWQYHRARWFLPQVGRFASLDSHAGPLEDPPSLHRYLYAKADPLLLVDPSGLTSAAALGTFIHQHIRGMYPNQAGLLPNAALPGILVDLMPDIADWMVKQVIEVKPASMYGLTGWSQLDLYINVLNSIGTEISVHRNGLAPWLVVPAARGLR